MERHRANGPWRLGQPYLVRHASQGSQQELNLWNPLLNGLSKTLHMNPAKGS